MNIKDSIKLISKAKSGSNQAQLDIYNHLYILEQEGIWKQNNYYKGDKKLEKTFIKSHFSAFILEAFGITIMWYKKVAKILEEKNGKDLFLEYGKSNMATYLNSSKEEQEAILAEVPKYKTIPRFWEVKRKLFPFSKTSDNGKVINVWKDKYNTLKAEFEEYKKETMAIIETLKKTIKYCFETNDKKIVTK